VEEYDVEGPHCIALSLRLPAERRSVLVALRSVRVRRNLALLSASKAHSMHARAHARAVRSLMSSMEEARRRRSARAV
jgi:hypothetical protein